MYMNPKPVLVAIILMALLLFGFMVFLSKRQQSHPQNETVEEGLSLYHMRKINLYVYETED